MMTFKLMRPYKIFRTGFLMLGVFAVSGCDLYQESWVTKNRAQVREDRFFVTFPVEEFDEKAISRLGQQYDRYGDGEIVVSVTYDPASQNFTALKATDESARIVQSFKKNGMKMVKAGILPVQDGAEKVLVSYTSFKAEAPEDCGMMPGVKSKEDIGGRDENYAVGCTIETLFSRQVSRPKDLRGRQDAPNIVDGRRVGNAVDAYRDGVPNEPFEDGESASE